MYRKGRTNAYPGLAQALKIIKLFTPKLETVQQLHSQHSESSVSMDRTVTTVPSVQFSQPLIYMHPADMHAIQTTVMQPVALPVRVEKYRYFSKKFAKILKNSIS